MQHLFAAQSRLLTASQVAALLGRCPACVSDLAPHRQTAINAGPYCCFDSYVLPDGAGQKGSGSVQAAICDTRPRSGTEMGMNSVTTELPNPRLLRAEEAARILA